MKVSANDLNIELKNFDAFLDRLDRNFKNDEAAKVSYDVNFRKDELEQSYRQIEATVKKIDFMFSQANPIVFLPKEAEFIRLALEKRPKMANPQTEELFSEIEDWAQYYLKMDVVVKRCKKTKSKFQEIFENYGWQPPTQLGVLQKIWRWLTTPIREVNRLYHKVTATAVKAAKVAAKEVKVAAKEVKEKAIETAKVGAALGATYAGYATVGTIPAAAAAGLAVTTGIAAYPYAMKTPQYLRKKRAELNAACESLKNQAVKIGKEAKEIGKVAAKTFPTLAALYFGGISWGATAITATLAAPYAIRVGRYMADRYNEQSKALTIIG
jgi:hypothetical protein